MTGASFAGKGGQKALGVVSVTWPSSGWLWSDCRCPDPTTKLRDNPAPGASSNPLGSYSEATVARRALC